MSWLAFAERHVGQTQRLTSEKELLGAKSTRREDDTATGVDVDSTAVATGGHALKLDAGDLAAGTDGTPDGAVDPEVEVGASERRNEVGGQGAATLAILKHKGAVAESAVLLCGDIVGNDLGVSGLVKAAREHVETLLAVELAVLAGGVRARDSLEHPVGSSRDVGVLPAGGEVIIPISRGRLENG